jgi:hypothetical protein
LNQAATSLTVRLSVSVRITKEIIVLLDAVRNQPLRLKKRTDPKNAVRLFPSMNGWFFTTDCIQQLSSSHGLQLFPQVVER